MFGNLAMILAYRAHGQTLVRALRAPNPALWWILALTLAALAAALYVPAVAAVFRLAPLAAGDLALAAAAGISGVAAYELVKLARH